MEAVSGCRRADDYRMARERARKLGLGEELGLDALLKGWEMCLFPQISRHLQCYSNQLSKWVLDFRPKVTCFVGWFEEYALSASLKVNE
ncbi:hypothetical protein CI238_00322 [Colletotrichum incanum]|uniref:Uncharacterized protein n=1 Tax=Colletotrichum incanum TaxID=1573173 RepID=A0A167BIZ5_COLIC|nr:hypothetical protein CI238_00322 [Colletotrichum incanum]